MTMNNPDFVIREGGETARYKWGNAGDELTLYREHTSDNVAAVLEENRFLRSEGGAPSVSFGAPILQIPYSVYCNLIRINPALRSNDPQERSQAWIRIAQDGGYRDLTVREKV